MNADDTVDKVASHFWPRDGLRDYFSSINLWRWELPA